MMRRAAATVTGGVDLGRDFLRREAVLGVLDHTVRRDERTLHDARACDDVGVCLRHQSTWTSPYCRHISAVWPRSSAAGVNKPWTRSQAPPAATKAASPRALHFSRSSVDTPARDAAADPARARVA